MALKLKQFTAATNNENNVDKAIFKFIVTGLLDSDPYGKTCLVADENYLSGSLYDEQLLNRLYAITNQQSTCSTPLEPLISITQFANSEFALTESTVVAPTYDGTSDQHSIGTYTIGSDEKSYAVVNNTINTIDKMSIITNNSSVFGYSYNSVEYVFVKDSSVSNQEDFLVYSLSTSAPDISKNYIMENRLTALPIPDYTLWGALNNNNYQVYVQSDVDGTDGYLTCYRKGDITNEDDLSYNFTPAKNIYDNNWSLQLDNNQLDAIREYTKIGNSNGSLYLKYRVYSGASDASIVTDSYGTVSLYEYEMIERVNGLYKFRSDDGHKSNVFSIRIENSGIKHLVDPTNVKYNQELKELLHNSVKKFVQKLIPANTQLWKIQFTGS